MPKELGVSCRGDVVPVGIDLDVAPVGSGQKVEDMVSVELADASPARPSNTSPLQLPVVIRVDAIDKRFSYLFL